MLGRILTLPPSAERIEVDHPRPLLDQRLCYYVRIHAADEELAWNSPIRIDPSAWQ
jgi:hypothetical protein